MKNNIIVTGVIVILVGALGFFGGMKYQQSKGSGNSGRQFAGGRPGGLNSQGRTGGNGRPVIGEIISQDDKSITVKLADGSSKIVLLTDKTAINKATEATKTDLVTGARVLASGTDNTDGSMTAVNIQLNPTFGGTNARMGNQAQKSSDAKEIVVVGSNYTFSPNKITIKKGEKTRIVFKNSDGTHDFRIDELNIAIPTIGSGAEDFVEFTPDKTGSFEFYCSIGNHRAMGMKGTIVVE